MSAELQAQVNRFSDLLTGPWAFEPLAITGSIDGPTASAVIKIIYYNIERQVDEAKENDAYNDDFQRLANNTQFKLEDDINAYGEIGAVERMEDLTDRLMGLADSIGLDPAEEAEETEPEETKEPETDKDAPTNWVAKHPTLAVFGVGLAIVIVGRWVFKE